MLNTMFFGHHSKLFNTILLLCKKIVCCLHYKRCIPFEELEEDFNVVFNDKCIGVGMSVGEMDILWVDALNGAFPSGEIECRVGRNEGCLSYD
ncbi:hypothetical protein V6N13_040575 [Hibiscus sabdariffa]